MEKYFIYSLSDENGYVRWIGCTKNIKSRFSGHIREAKQGIIVSRKNNWISNCLLKSKQINIEVIEEFEDIESAWFWEQFYISLYRSFGFDLFNIAIGGGGGNGVKRKDLSCKNKEKCSQTVFQITTKGVIINRFESAKEARRKTKINNIQFCASGSINHRTAGGFIWIWEKDFTHELLKERIYSWENMTWGSEKRLGANNSSARKIQQLNPVTNEIISEFGCIRDARREVGKGKGDIGACCGGRQKTACGFKWRYAV